jgi:hypothetical protein
MKFEYKEYEPVSIFIDIGIKIPEGPKIFVEVKETKTQWEILISGVKAIGMKGADLKEPDRGNDPLRNAKYILASRPDFFIGYSPEGFDSYKVIYEPKGRFQLEPDPMPKTDIRPQSCADFQGDRMGGREKMAFVNELLGFLQQGMREPNKTFQYLESKKKCSNCPSRCNSIQPYFSSQNPWGDGLNPFLEWAQQWSPEVYSEWPILAVFLNSLIAQFLASKGMDETGIRQSFRMEFTGGGRKAHFVPPCLLRKNPQDSVCIGKKIRGQDICCDFLLLLPFPALVGEVKVAVPNAGGRIFSNFRDDLIKCEEWLAQEASHFIQNRFGIASFDYSLAILIDLSGGKYIQNAWEASINEEDYFRRGIFARLISPILLTAPPQFLDGLERKTIQSAIIRQQSPSDHGLTSAHAFWDEFKTKAPSEFESAHKILESMRKKSEIEIVQQPRNLRFSVTLANTGYSLPLFYITIDGRPYVPLRTTIIPHLIEAGYKETIGEIYGNK